MDFISVALIIVILTNLMLVVVSSLCPKDSSSTGSIYIAYLFNVTTITWWVSSMVLFREINSDFVTKNLYISATCIASSLYYFSLVFPFKEKSFRKDLFRVVVLNILIISLILGTNLIVTFDSVGEVVRFGSGYIIYVCYTLILFTASFWKLFSHFVEIKTRMEKFQSLSFFVGYTISGIIGITTNLFLPWFNIPEYQYLGPLSTVCVVLSISFAVKRFRLFNIQIAATEAFVLLLWVFTVLRVCLVEEKVSVYINILYILLVIIVGILSIINVKKEHVQYLNNLELVKELKDLNARLNEVDTQKTKFVSLAAHHIASPLTSIKAYLSLLRGEYGGTFNGEDLKTVEQIMEDLVCILKDFLDVSRIEIQGIEINGSSENVVTILNSLCLNLSDKMNAKNISLVKSYDDEMEVLVEVDAQKIKNAFENILENSILYSKDSSIEIEVKQNVEHIEIYIHDHGVRKFPHVQESLVLKFSESNNQREADIVGRGLGLYIAKKIIEAHKGSFEVATKEPQTSFVVRLPRAV